MSYPAWKDSGLFGKIWGGYCSFRKIFLLITALKFVVEILSKKRFVYYIPFIQDFAKLVFHNGSSMPVKKNLHATQQYQGAIKKNKSFK